MEREELESRLIDYIDGQLNEEERKETEQLLATSEEARMTLRQLQTLLAAMTAAPPFDAGDRLTKGFEEALKKEEQALQSSSKQVFFTPAMYKIAASVVLVLSMATLGYWISRNIQQEKELTALRAEMEQTKQLMLSMLDNDQSASQRMKAVNVAMDIRQVDDDIIQALSNTMTNDPNTNVRLAAMEALSKFSEEAEVREILISSLSRQTDPVVQIALIQLLVEMKEKGVVKDLEDIIDNEENIQAVKDEAYTGILKLS